MEPTRCGSHNLVIFFFKLKVPIAKTWRKTYAKNTEFTVDHINSIISNQASVQQREFGNYTNKLKVFQNINVMNNH